MAAEHSVRWTVLPNGFADATTVRVSVLVSPRLSGGSRLAEFAALRHWPVTLAPIVAALGLEFARGTDDTPYATVTGAAVDHRFPPADAALWDRLFRDDTPVDAPKNTPTTAAGPPARKTLRSFPGRLVHREVTALYQNIAAYTTEQRLDVGHGQSERDGCEPPPTPEPQGWQHPPLPVLRDNLADGVLDLAKNPKAAYDKLDGLLDGTSPDDAGSPHLPRYVDRTTQAYQDEHRTLAFAEAHRFYDRGKAPRTDGVRADVPVKRVDFHLACAMLADYPELQRRFGLVVDLVLAVPAGLADGDRLRVVVGDSHPDHQQLNAVGLRPWTRVRHVAGSRFEPFAADDDRVGRRTLDLGRGDEWTVTDLDLDGAALKHVDFARTVAGMVEDQVGHGSAIGAGTPAARGAGITVLHDVRDQVLAQQLRSNGDRIDAGATADAVLSAADLVRGYRIDVGIADESGAVARWYPLSARQGSYTIRRPGAPPEPIDVRPDEGLVKSSAVTKDATDDDLLYGHQALFGWDGWSLAAPRPGKTLNVDNRPEAVNPPVSPDVPLDVEFTPRPGTLPALRYGRTYRFRARLVDLAGNSLDPAAVVDDRVLTAPFTYQRWEPVPQPVVVPLWPFGEGESAERLVIRSTVTDDGREVSTHQYALLRSDLPDHGEQSGVDGLDRRYRWYDERFLVAPKTSVQMAEEHGVFDAAFGPEKPERLREQYFAAAARESGSFLDTVVSYPDDPERTRDLLFFGEIAVAKHDVDDREPVTALPLPHRGHGLKQGEFVVHNAQSLILPYLPDVLARGVSLRGLPGAERNHKVPFPDPWPWARPFKLRIEEGEDEPDWVDVGDFRVLTVYLVKGEAARVVVSSYFDVEDLPLLRQWNLLTASSYWQGLGDQDRAEVRQASADGENWMLSPWVVLNLVHAVEKPVLRPGITVAGFDREPEQTSASVYGVITSHAASTGQVGVDATWQEWVDDVTQPAPRSWDGYAHVADVRMEPDRDTRGYGVTHEFGDTKHRNVGYTPTATTRFREYFHPTITADASLITRVGPTASGADGLGNHVPSSRRPEPPDAAYLVPTFRWRTVPDPANGRITQLREHAGLRVYLNRPWFSSGEDEVLAVLLDPGTALPDRLVTRWGVDPVWGAAAALPAPAPAHFPNAAGTRTDLVLAESGDPVTAVWFQPRYHQDRRLWYCDVDIDPGAAYFPFVRLALARYQPYSLGGLELSDVVLAEFGQVVPDRSVTASREGDELVVRLSGPAGPNELGGLAGAGVVGAAASRKVTVALQTRKGLGEDDMDWRPLGPATELACAPDGDSFAWRGGFRPPSGQLLSRYRLVVREHELYRTDPDTATETVTVNGQVLPVARRLVHADYVALRVGLLGRLEIDV